MFRQSYSMSTHYAMVSNRLGMLESTWNSATSVSLWRSTCAVALPNNIPEPTKNTTIIKAITNKITSNWIVFMMLLIDAKYLTSYSEYTVLKSKTHILVTSYHPQLNQLCSPSGLTDNTSSCSKWLFMCCKQVLAEIRKI